MKAIKQLVKLGSKGQITLPKAVREDLRAKRGDLLMIYKLDDHRYAIEKRTLFEVLTEEIAQEAERKGYTEEDLRRTVEAVREELWQEFRSKYLKGKVSWKK